MEYYKLIYDYENSNGAKFISIDEKTLPFGRYEMDNSKKINVEKVYAITLEENIKEFDFIANNLAWMIVSEKMKRFLENYNLEECEFIPVIEKGTDDLIGYAIHCMNILPALDKKRSLYRKTTLSIDGQAVEHMIIMKYALLKSEINGIDVFKIKECTAPFFVSEKLKKGIEKNKLLGFDFQRIFSR